MIQTVSKKVTALKIAHLRIVVALMAMTFLTIALWEAIDHSDHNTATEQFRSVAWPASNQDGAKLTPVPSRPTHLVALIGLHKSEEVSPDSKPAVLAITTVPDDSEPELSPKRLGGVLVSGQSTATPSNAIEAPRAAQDFFQNLDNPLTDSDLSRVDKLSGSIRASEWLGPLAPIAISPFFGVTILAGLAQFGSDWVPGNEFISNNAVLKNPAVFWVFLVLTVITSVPRFTKVSKPAAQAIDQLEAYAGIVTIILLRVLMTSGESITPEATEMPVALQAGIFTFTVDTLMCIAAAINILVINTVKFFFEVSVWLIPFPMVDAMLEIANKSLCAALMAVYVWDARIATAINLIIFAVCLIAFRWIHRRTVYLRSMLFDPVWTLVSPGYGIPCRDHLTVFNKSRMGPFAAKSRLRLTVQENGWSLTEQRLLFPGRTIVLPGEVNEATIQKGLIGNQITFDHADGQLILSRRYSANLPTLARRMRMNLVEQGRAGEEADLVDVLPV